MSVLSFWRGTQAKSKNERIITFSDLVVCAIIMCAALLSAPQSVFAAKLIVATPKQAYSVGDTLQAVVNVSSSDAAVNAFSGTVTFPKELLQVTSVSKVGSVVSVWAEDPTFSNTDGTAHFEGVVMNPGYTGASGKIVTITFKVKAAGDAELALTGGSVLANDGQGTNVLTDMTGTKLTLSAAKVVPQSAPVRAPAPSPTGTSEIPAIISPTHPNNNKWYSATEAVFRWEIPEGVTAVRSVADKQPRTTPSGTGDTNVTEKKVSGLDDGIHYFHLQYRDKSGWGVVSHYRFQVDSKAPEQFAVTLLGGDSTDDPRPDIAFKATDVTSGIDRYELTFFTNENDIITVRPEDMPNGVYKPEALTHGKKLLIVKAFDRAGNKTTETVEFTIREVKGLIVTSYPKSIDEEYALRLTGRTLPQSTITFTLSDAVSGQQFTDQAQSNTKGEFKFTWGEKVPAGTYVLTAVNKDARGAISTLEPALKIEITRSLFVRLIAFISTYFWIIVLVLLSALGAGVLGWIIRHRKGDVRAQQ